MQEVKLCRECYVEKTLACFQSFTVRDNEKVTTGYSSVCEECKIQKMMEKIPDRYEYDRQFIRKLRETPEYRQHEKEYREKNKDKINAHYREKVTCTCGCVLSKGSLSKHKTSQQHINATN